MKQKHVKKIQCEICVRAKLTKRKKTENIVAETLQAEKNSKKIIKSTHHEHTHAHLNIFRSSNDANEATKPI